MKQILVAVLFFLFSNLYSQLSSEVLRLVNTVPKATQSDLQFVDLDNSESKVYKICDSISKIAANKEKEYLAFNGDVSLRYFFMKKLVESNSSCLTELYKKYLKDDKTITLKYGCIVDIFNLANVLYESVYLIPDEISRLKKSKKLTKEDMFFLKELGNGIPKNYNNWTIKQAKKRIAEFDEVALNDKETKQANIEFICMINESFEVQVSKYEKLVFFQEKYNSSIISEYIDYCKKK